MNENKINAIPEMDIARLNAYFPQTDWSKYFWGFTCYSRQKYAETVPLDAVDEIMLGVQCAQGGCLCELAFRWHMIGGSPAPRLEIFDSAWPLLHTSTLALVMELLIRMGKIMNTAPTSDEVSALLIACGFKDQSDRPLEQSYE